MLLTNSYSDPLPRSERRRKGEFYGWRKEDIINMAISGDAYSAGYMNFNHAVKATDIDLKPGGNLTITVPQIKVRIPDIRLKFWFFPALWLKGFEVLTEQTTVQFNLDTAKVRAEIREPSPTPKQATVEVISTISEKGSVISGKEL